MRGSLFHLFPLFWWFITCHLVKTWTTKIGEIGPLSVFPGWSAKTMRWSLFPLLPLRVKCQNHERVPISPIFPISPILVANIYSSCQDMDHQNRGNRGNRDGFGTWLLGEIGEIGPFQRFPWVKCQNHERVPISPILVVHVLTKWQDMDHQNRGNRDPLMVLALHP